MHGELGSDVRPRSAAQGRQHARLPPERLRTLWNIPGTQTPAPRSFPKPVWPSNVADRSHSPRFLAGWLAGKRCLYVCYIDVCYVNA